MIKGCSKKIYHVKNISDKYFDEVYFILKDGVTPSDNKSVSATLAEEADRIIREASASFKPKRQDKTAGISRLLAFFVGVMTSSGILGIIALLAVI